MTHLDLSNNKITCIPEGVLPRGLTELTLTGNHLTELPSDIAKLTNLKKIFAGANRCAHAPTLHRPHAHMLETPWPSSPSPPGTPPPGTPPSPRLQSPSVPFASPTHTLCCLLHPSRRLIGGVDCVFLCPGLQHAGLAFNRLAVLPPGEVLSRSQLLSLDVAHNDLEGLMVG